MPLTTFHPFLVAEPIGQMDVNPAESQWHGMHPRGGAGGGPHAETAIQQGVIDLQPEVDPAPFGETSLGALELRHIEEVLHATGGNKSEAAKRLGINRRKLYRLIEKLKVDDKAG